MSVQRMDRRNSYPTTTTRTDLIKKGIDMMARHGVKYVSNKISEAVKRRRHNAEMEKSYKRRKTSAAKPPPKWEKGSARAVEVKGGAQSKKYRPSVKVSKPLRDKIEKVLEEKKVRGYYQVTMYGNLLLPESNQQLVQTLRDPLHTANVFSSFSVHEFLHEASVLWNQKLDSSAQRNVLIGNVGVTSNTATLPPDAISSLACTAKLTVLNSSEDYYFKNNSERAVNIDMYICNPKRAMFENLVANDEQGTARTASPYDNSNPQLQWAVALAGEYKTAGNVANIGPNQLHTTPSNLAMFTKLYKPDVVHIRLEPGQDYTYKLLGPKLLDLDCSKYYTVATNGIMQSVQKFSKCVMFIVKVDLVHQGEPTTGYSGRLKHTSDNSPNCISVERVLRTSLSIPESVAMKVDGTIISGAGTHMLTNSNRIRKYFVDTYTVAGSGAVRRVDEQNADDEVL
uniref:Capsid protein n=1 Tax=Cressdnaviricota sp. TaxID=2748378 RepID=A0A345MQ24_9VIRU